MSTKTESGTTSEVALELYRQVSPDPRPRAAAQPLRRGARLRRLLAPGARPGGGAGRGGRGAAPRRLPLLRPPRARLRAGQGDVARGAARRPLRRAPAAASAARAAAPSTSSTPSSACSARAAPSAPTSCSAPAPRSRSQLLGEDRVVAIFFGDGAAARGTFHEAALQAVGLEAAGRLGLREQRLGASRRRSRAEPDRRTSPTAPPPTACRASSSTARTRSRSARRPPRRSTRARAGEGPTLIEAKTLRIRGHYEGDQQRYRDDLADGLDVPRDPLMILRERVPAEQRRRGSTPRRETEAEAALEAALAMPKADASSRHRGRLGVSAVAERAAGVETEQLGYARAINAGAGRGDAPRRARLDDGPGHRQDGRRLRRHPRPLRRVRPGRVRDTTINETFIVGGAAGAAMTGTIPVVELQFADFLPDRRRRDLPQARQVALHARRQALAAGRACACRPASSAAPAPNTRRAWRRSGCTSPASKSRCRRPPPTPRAC